MWAPTDKKNDTIQILITRACDLFNCSNCTQLLPLRVKNKDRDPIHMDIDVFRDALRSLKGWPGIRGMFGGNPCVHPRFPDMMQVLVEEVPDQRQRGLWSNNLMQHGALVREVFYPHARFNLNAHANTEAADEIERWCPGKLIPTSRDRTSWHSPILLNWQDFGISEEEWIRAREDCDINRDWSAAIMQRDGKAVAYFCEVAGALDGMRGENNGIPVEPDWWRWKMPKFQNQVAMCCDRGCGVPLRRLGSLDRDDTYDFSQSFSPYVELTIDKMTTVKGKLHRAIPEGTERATDYQALKTFKPKG